MIPSCICVIAPARMAGHTVALHLSQCMCKKILIATTTAGLKVCFYQSQNGRTQTTPSAFDAGTTKNLVCQVLADVRMMGIKWLCWVDLLECTPWWDALPVCQSCRKKTVPFALTASTTGFQASICSCV